MPRTLPAHHDLRRRVVAARTLDDRKNVTNDLLRLGEDTELLTGEFVDVSGTDTGPALLVSHARGLRFDAVEWRGRPTEELTRKILRRLDKIPTPESESTDLPTMTLADVKRIAKTVEPRKKGKPRRRNKEKTAQVLVEAVKKVIALGVDPTATGGQKKVREVMAGLGHEVSESYVSRLMTVKRPHALALLLHSWSEAEDHQRKTLLQRGRDGRRACLNHGELGNRKAR